MCKKLKEIHHLSPSIIMERYLNPSDIFVNMRKILEEMGIECNFVDFTELEKGLFMESGSILGMAVTKQDDLSILCSNKLEWNEANYVLAHELGHCCLHLPVTSEFHVEMKTKYTDFYSYPPSFFRSFQNVWSDNQTIEQQADAFAVELLIPKMLQDSYHEAEKEMKIDDLAEKFHIPLKIVKLHKNMFGSNRS